MDGQGTPKTLDEAIARELAIAQDMGKLRQSLYWAVRDFLAQRVNVALLLADPDEAERLDALFAEIVRRDR